MNNFFYLPFLYSFKTRFTSLTKKVSWAIIYLIPVSFSGLFIIDFTQFSLSNLIVSLFGILLIYTLYETGYIYNDTETVKIEKKPTLRLNPLQLKYYEKHKTIIYLSRLVVAIIISIGIYIHTTSPGFIIATWSLIPLYAIYNSIRNRWNILIHFFLVLIRFCSIPLLFSPNIPITSTAYLILLFPLLNTLERCREKRFNFYKLQKITINNASNGRYIYYFILLLLSSSILIINFINDNYIHPDIVFFLYSLYFFSYRFLAIKMMKKL